MPTATLNITRGIPGKDISRGAVWLSQEPPKVRRPSPLDLAAGLSKILTGGAGPAGDCGFDLSSGGYATTVYVSSTPPELRYECGAAPGEIIERTKSRREHGQVVSFMMGDTATLDWPPRSISSMRWEGRCYNAAGDIVSPPEPGVDGDQIHLAYPVYGTLSVVYVVQVEEVKVRLLTGGHLGAHFYAAWNGGVELLELTIPGSAAAASESGECPDWETELDPSDADEPDSPPKVRPENETVYIDYCTQEEE